MSLRFYRSILLIASLFVPPPARTEWLREWKSELYYLLESRVSRPGAIRFCLGSFRDAFWFSRNLPSGKAGGMLRLRSPGRCLVLLSCFASGATLLAALNPQLSQYMEPGFLFAEIGTAGIALLLLPAVMSFGTCEYPSAPHSSIRNMCPAVGYSSQRNLCSCRQSSSAAP